jgi:hypothetical protein
MEKDLNCFDEWSFWLYASPSVPLKSKEQAMHALLRVSLLFQFNKLSGVSKPSF